MKTKSNAKSRTLGKRPIGRPRILASPAEFEKRAEKYFTECDAKNKPYSVTALAIAIGFTSKEMLSEYARRAEFSDSVKKAKAKIEAKYEEMLFDKNYSTAGVIFVLKNNYGWRDKTDLEVTGDTVRVEKIEIKLQ